MHLIVRRAWRWARPAWRCLTRPMVALVALLTAGVHPAGAQWRVMQADSLLASGQVAAAESMYYAASSASPRNPLARAALGRYLASRGALRIGAVLLEEARQFGGDSAAIGRALTPIYRSLGDYRALAVLPKAALSVAERGRVSWLVSHQQAMEFEDTVATIPYTPVNDGTGLGLVTIQVGERAVDALVDPRVSGVMLRGGAARRQNDLRVFGRDSLGIVAVIPELHIGGVILTNVPARIDTAPRLGGTRKAGQQPSVVGLDVLQRLAPTFDPATSTLALRRSGTIGPSAPGKRSPFLLDESGLRLLVGGRWDATTSPSTAALLATRRWTLDARRGEAIMQ